MDEIKLKPCPFCGGDAEMQQGKYQGLRTFYVSCLGCGARSDLEYAEEFAADLWNERVSYVNKRAMISQPMAGKTDEEIAEARDKAHAKLREMGYEFVNTLFTDEWYSDEAMEERGVVQVPLCYLAKSLENMSLCHAAYFCKGWENARGCRIEHDAAVAYGLEVLYED